MQNWLMIKPKIFIYDGTPNHVDVWTKSVKTHGNHVCQNTVRLRSCVVKVRIVRSVQQLGYLLDDRETVQTDSGAQPVSMGRKGDYTV
jgi:hypothetical protein